MGVAGFFPFSCACTHEESWRGAAAGLWRFARVRLYVSVSAYTSNVSGLTVIIIGQDMFAEPNQHDIERQ